MVILIKFFYLISENMMVSNRVSRFGFCTVGYFDYLKLQCIKNYKKSILYDVIININCIEWKI